MASDMTKGKIVKQILMFSLPLIIGNIFQQLYNMVDAIIVGKTIGETSLAAVGSTGAISFLIVGFVIGVTSGFGVIISQRFGAGDPDGVRKSVATSFILCVGITIVVTIVAVLTAHPLLKVMKTGSEIYQQAYDYIIVIFWGIFAAVFYNIVSCIIRALGDSRTPLIFLIVASIINIILDFVFILYFKMGVAGAGWATVVSQFVAGVACLLFMMKKYKHVLPTRADWKTSWAFMWKHLRIGLPMAFQFSITAIGVMFIQAELNTHDIATIAAFTAASKIDQLATQVLLSFGATMATFAGQNYGAGQFDRIRKGVLRCSIISVAFSIVAGITLIIFSDQLVSLFLDVGNPLIFDRAREYLIINGSNYWILALLFVFRNSLQGMGKGLITVTAGVMELLMRLLAARYLAGVFGFAGICAANPLAWLGATVVLVIAYFVIMRKYSNFSRRTKKGLGGKVA